MRLKMFGGQREIQTLIRDRIYTVRLVRRVPKIDHEHVKGHLRGLCHFEEGIIYLKDNLSAEDLLATLIHEYLHALAYEWGFDLSHKIIEKLELPAAKLLLDNFL
jgi:hypothetical protein